MGERGPAKQPSAIQKRRGNPGKRKNANEPQPDEHNGEFPEGLIDDEEAISKWNEIVPVLKKNGLMAELDADFVVLYCKAWSEFVRLDNQVRGQECLQGGNGGFYQNPSLSIRNKAQDRLLKIGKLFGLSPAARAGLSVEANEEVSALQGFIKRAHNL